MATYTVRDYKVSINKVCTTSR